MIIANRQKIKAVLYILLKVDTAVFTYSFQVDGKECNLSLANKGIYSVHLGTFSLLELTKIENISWRIKKIDEALLNFVKTYDIPYLKVDTQLRIVRHRPYLFSDLQEENGVNTRLSFKRLLNLTYLYKETNNMDFLEDIKDGLDFLFSNWYKGTSNYIGNWWDYEIGIPKIINEIFFLIYDDLEKSFIDNGLNIEHFYLPNPLYLFYRRNYPNIKREVATYANLADNIYISTLKAILQNDFSSLGKYFKLIVRTLKTVTNKDGFYLDGSFIQHINIPYNASYGEVLINALSKILEIYHLLGFDCSKYLLTMQKQISLSYDPFLYRGKALDCVRGRAASRKKMDAKYSADTILKAIEKINDLMPSEYLTALLKRQGMDNGVYEDELRVFNYIDCFIKRTNEYLVTISANSSYIANYESILGENTEAYYQANFTMSLINQNHCADYYLLANPFYLMGSTNTSLAMPPNKVIKNDLTAGVTLDNVMLVAYSQNTDVKGLFSKAVLDKSIVCLGSHIHSSASYVTTMYQDTYSEPQKKQGEIIIKDVRLVTRQDVYLEKTSCQRSYKQINKTEDDTMYQGDFLVAYLKNVKNYEYQIYPQFQSYEEYRVIENSDIQIIAYQQKLLISKFLEESFTYQNITLKGVMVCIISSMGNDIVVKWSTGKRVKQAISVSIAGYEVSDSDLNYQQSEFIVTDELEHFVKFRRKYD